ncbi:hypothetical protein [Pseudomonas viridiflava]|uniref:hypothetical protein n=1 Tax=Pseudomonas viridiflava TaxID=33069 RepID=UPI000F047212|nr:hypothetical protein [Pseudomonas viridiflava]
MSISLRYLKHRLQTSDNGSVTQGWGAVLAISFSELNEQLLVQYLERHARLSFLPSFSGDIDSTDKAVNIHLSRIELGVPVLSISSASAYKQFVQVTIGVVSGTCRISRCPQGSATTVSQDVRITEAMGFSLQAVAELQLDDDLGVTLDLAKAFDFTCNVAGADEVSSALVAKFIEQKFNNLRLHQSSFFLVQKLPPQVLSGSRLFIQPAPGSHVRGARNFGAGALVVFMRLRGRPESGRFPPTSDFPFLIPDASGADKRAGFGVTLALSRDARGMTAEGLAMIVDSLRFAGRSRFVEVERDVSSDLVLFGTLASPQAAISPSTTRLYAGEQRRFVLQDADGMELDVDRWEVRGLESHTLESQGKINPLGVYTAARVDLLGHESLRVAIIATYGGARPRVASALVTVVYEKLELGPRLVLVAGGTRPESVTLKASDSDGAVTLWALHSPEYGVLSEVEGGALFTPDERSVNKALIAQQIEAGGADGKVATVLIANGQPMLRIDPVFVARARKSTPVKLTDDATMLPGFQRRWHVISGAGSVNDQGEFSPPLENTGSNSVVRCEIVREGMVLACGYSVIEVSDLIDEPTWSELSVFKVVVPNIYNLHAGKLLPNGRQQLAFRVETQTMDVSGVNYPLSPAEMASMRLVDKATSQEIAFLLDGQEAIAEAAALQEQQLWATHSLANRFDLATWTMASADVPDTFAAAESSLISSSTVVQPFYLQSRAPAGMVTEFYARFQSETKAWFESIQFADEFNRITIEPLALVVFDTKDYSFEPHRVEGNDIPPPTAEPPPPAADGDVTSDPAFNLVFKSVDFWALKVLDPMTRQWMEFYTVEFLPSVNGSDDINCSALLWESEQLNESFVSWTGYIFQAIPDGPSVEKISFDPGVSDVTGTGESLDKGVVLPGFEVGSLVISLHRSWKIPYRPAGDAVRDRLYRPLAVMLIDQKGNVHRRYIDFRPSGVGRRNRLLHSLYTPFKP